MSTIASLHKDIHKLILGLNERDTNTTKLDMILDEVSINLHMFCSIMLDWIICDVDSYRVITKEIHENHHKKSQFIK